MAYLHCKPSALLAPYVDAYWMVRQPVLKGTRILPDGCQDVMVATHDPTQCRLVGTLTSYVDAHEATPATWFGIRFKPAGLAAFIPVPQDQLCGQVLELRTVHPPFARLIGQVDLSGSATFSQWVATIESVLRQQIATLTLPDRRVTAAVQAILQTGGQLSVRAVAGQACLSERQLERHFLHAVGIAPKFLMELIRFRALTQLLRQQPFLSLTEAAFQTGYYDSAQLTRVFKRFAGELPSHYRHRAMSVLYKGQGG